MPLLLRLAAAVVLTLASITRAQEGTPDSPDATPISRLIELYRADADSLAHRYRLSMSEVLRARMQRFHTAWLADLDARAWEALSAVDRVDAVLFRNHLHHELDELARELARDAELHELMPFAAAIVALEEARRRFEPVAGRQVAARLTELVAEVEAQGKKLAEGAFEDVAATRANRAIGRLDGLRRTLRSWFEYFDGYDPSFGWWVRSPYKDLARAIERYRDAVRRKLVKGDGDGDDTLIGDPIGADALASELAFEMIPYSPAELVAIAEREFEWCDREMAKAARELGFDDWRGAQEHVKTLHVEPGRQPELIRDLAAEAVQFLEERDLVTIPEVCRESWRMDMMSPERQRVSPYFLGGDTIIVSYPTEDMAHADKLMSMRGNNIHFARATVHHELIPGHHLQGFMTARHRPYRRLFRTPFWIEGWALYWEMRLWDLGFARSPEDRIGMLFWRKHRCARIIFSLRFHLGTMTAPVAVDFLVTRVGHERNNATAEVRRSIGGDYGPLYQAAYMLGGLQLRALHGELVASGKMTERAFHDAVLHENAIPIAILRVALTGAPLDRDFTPSWRFYGDPTEAR